MPEPTRTAEFSKAHDLTRTSAWSALQQRFWDRALNMAVVAEAHSWSELATDELASAFEMLLSEKWKVNRVLTHGFRAWLADTGHALVLFSYDAGGGEWHLSVAAPRQDVADRMVGRVASAFPAPSAADDDSGVFVRFWTLGSFGPVDYVRRLAAAPWGSVSGNYPGAIQERLGQLMGMTAPDAGGRLVLWHGPPGCGKTHCIRALAQAWKPWCDIEYVVDADKFFGEAMYMVGTMVMRGDADDDRWRLLVVEDAGEWLMDGVRGQGLARLLNLTDGLVGQGLRLLVLMTTNEPLESLHSAVTRPGRCMANVEFGTFAADEANKWLEAQASEHRVDDGAQLTLADLYALG